MALPTVAQSAAPTDKHPQWLAQFNHTRDLWRVQVEGSHEEKNLWDTYVQYESLICNTVAQTNDGLVAQMRFLIQESEGYWSIAIHETLARNVLRGLN